MGLTVELLTAGPPRHFVGQAIGDAGDKVPEFQIAEVTFDDSYPTSGETLDPDEFGFSSFFTVIPEPITNGGYFVRFDPDNDLLLAFYGDTNAVADGAFIEVPNGTDLAAESVRLLVFGYR